MGICTNSKRGVGHSRSTHRQSVTRFHLAFAALNSELATSFFHSRNEVNSRLLIQQFCLRAINLGWVACDFVVHGHDHTETSTVLLYFTARKSTDTCEYRRKVKTPSTPPPFESERSTWHLISIIFTAIECFTTCA